ncbi:cytochrome c oxidase assembly protein [Sphingomonas aracearum]|uniref:cytochrome c oxidase assembly protein n=1 Tax=Sphingomonas aracearum TaxID=2283317 RepID=UPI001EEF9675|nr:cytochrome c oxidase assembly protein [Sphingomonas aracearum]
MKRSAILAAALVALAIAAGTRGMTGHMAAHMIAVALAAPALALALRGSRWEPAALLASPLAWSVLELATVWLLHLPQVRMAAGHATVAMVAEIGCFLLVGTGLWSAVLAHRGQAGAAGIGALLLTSMHMTLLGALIGLAPRPLYAGMAHGAPWGLGALEDQQLAGVVMLLVGGASYLLGALAVLAGMLRQGEAQAA